MGKDNIVTHKTADKIKARLVVARSLEPHKKSETFFTTFNCRCQIAAGEEEEWLPLIPFYTNNRLIVNIRGTMPSRVLVSIQLPPLGQRVGDLSVEGSNAFVK